MGYYLYDHPNPFTPQYRCPRRAPLSGTVSVHTTEGALDAIAPDTGAENVASFISNRKDYGSYHEIHDSDSFIKMADDGCETWNVAEGDNFGMGMNSHNWGISAACRSTEWDVSDPWTKKTIASMGKSIREFWQRNGFNVQQCARWLTRQEAKNRVPGLVHHGVVQPSDRSDAWRDHPQRKQLDQMLIDAILQNQPGPPPSNEEEDMVLEIVKFPDKPNLWLHGYDRDGEFFWPVPSPADIDPAQKLRTRLLAAGDTNLDARFKKITGI